MKKLDGTTWTLIFINAGFVSVGIKLFFFASLFN